MKSKCCNKEMRTECGDWFCKGCNLACNGVSAFEVVDEVSEGIGRLLKQADDLHKHRTVPPSKKEIHDLVTTAYKAGRKDGVVSKTKKGTALAKISEWVTKFDRDTRINIKSCDTGLVAVVVKK